MNNKISEYPIISLVAPVYNEADSLSDLFSALAQIRESLFNLGFLLEVLLVDNHSSDNSWKQICLWASELSSDCYKVAIRHPENLGMQNSLITGIRHSRGDVIVVMQSDLQDPPHLVVEMVKLWSEGAKIVFSKIKKRNGDLFSRLGSWLFYRLLRIASSHPVQKDSSDFYLFDSSFKDTVIKESGTTPFIRHTLSSLDARKSIIPYERLERSVGRSKFNLRSRLSFGATALIRDLDGLTVKIALLSSVMGFASFGSLIMLAISFTFGYRSPVSGWVSSTALQLLTLASVLFLGSALLFIASKIYKELPRSDRSVNSVIIRGGLYSHQ
jgi:glycosyltransferase involved in cell wall biosynthesis